MYRSRLPGPSAAKAARKEQKHKSRSTMRAKDGTHDDSRRRTSAERQRLSRRYARPASRFPARPGALPCLLRRIPFDRPAMLRMYRGLDGRNTLSKCRVKSPRRRKVRSVTRLRRRAHLVISGYVVTSKAGLARLLII